MRSADAGLWPAGLSREARIGGTPGSRSRGLPRYVTSFSLRARRYLRDPYVTITTPRE
jgi:hypothetical protein